MTYQEVNPSIFKFEKEGDSIEGILVRVQSDIGENSSMLYSIETPEGVKNVWGSQILNERLALVKVDEKVKITFKGLSEKKAKGKNAARIFKVEVDKNPIAAPAQ